MKLHLPKMQVSHNSDGYRSKFNQNGHTDGIQNDGEIMEKYNTGPV